MTIRTHVAVRALNDRLGNIETCHENAPEGTFDVSHAFVDAMNDTFRDLIENFRSRGFTVPVNDRMREVEAMVAGLILDNDDVMGHALAACEGFGNALNISEPEVRERIIANMTRDRDFIRDMKEAHTLETIEAILNG